LGIIYNLLVQPFIHKIFAAREVTRVNLASHGHGKRVKQLTNESPHS